MRASTAAFEALQAAEPAVVFALYLDLLQQAPERAHVAAHSLSLKARSGAIDERSISLLAACLHDAPDEACVLHLAKALAVFGRHSQVAAAALADKIRGMAVTHDAAYWAFEGSVMALGFLGGPEAHGLLDELARERPPRPVATEAEYFGIVPAGRRVKRFASMMADVRCLLDEDDPKWDSARTVLVRRADQPESPRRQATWH